MKILFQGDSITDAGRDRSNIHNLGFGYAKYSAELIKDNISQTDFEFVNLGISGNKINDLMGRWKADCLDINPDIVSILIGINDTWHHSGDRNWMPNDYFEGCYRTILSQIKQETNAKIIILEQFLLAVPDKEFFHEDLDSKIQITRKLAREFADIFIPTDGLFAAASVGTAPTVFADDGVHPSEIGAKFIANHYLQAIKAII